MGLTRIRAEQISNIDYKQAVRVVTTTNITSLAGGAPATVDSVSLQTGDRILVTGQDPASQNGIYVVQTLGTGTNGTWVRSSDANQTGEIEPGMVVMVTEGTTYADTPWKLTTNGAIVIGTTALTFVQFSTGAPGGSTNQIQFNNANTFAGSPSLTWNGTELYVNGAANVTGNISGNYFIGNGSQLTGISTSTDRIFSGSSNVDIASANANITMSVNGTSNVVVVSATGVTVAGSIAGNGIPTTTVSNVAPENPEQGDIWIVGNTGVQLIYFTSEGNSQWAEMEASQSFSSTGTNYGNTEVAAYLPTYSGNIGDGTGYVFGNGSQLTGLPAGYTDSDVANVLAEFGSNSISTTGNVTAGNVTVNNDAVITGMLTATGNVTGNYILGNGALLTGVITSVANINNGNSNVTVVSSGGNVTVGVNGSSNVAVFSSDRLTVAGNILPSANITYNLGSASQRWNDIWLSNSTIYLGSAQISANATALTLTNPGGGTTVLSGASPEVSANTITATGNITGNYILGNGSQLTGITGGSTATNGIFVNTSNVATNYTIDTGTNGMSVGPITVNNGVVMAVATGQRWVIL